ncbi:MAG: M23 family metallopeptidase [Oscillospiraceae bacterium]|jgi:murein DD-endopeptidase MepM/ murein hydrolase activator NlpD|nr:M23 family metallopeptidase [Oscillospiraceae bacterium]
MDEKKSLFQKIGSFAAGKGFYVILFACFATIGVSAYMLVHGGPQSDTSGGTGVSDGTEYEAAQLPYAPAPATGYEAGAERTPQPVPPAQSTQPTPPAQSGARVDASAKDPAPATAPAAEPAPAAAPENTSAPAEAEIAGDDGAAASAPVKPLEFVRPLAGEIIFPYSIDELVYNATMGDWRVHDGIDIAGVIGTKVVSVADGEVADIVDDDLLGTTVSIDHGRGIVSRYSNLASVPAVQKGDKIAMGAVIGSIGDTALGEAGEPSHLHFSMTKDGKSVDPAEYLK